MKVEKIGAGQYRIDFKEDKKVAETEKSKKSLGCTVSNNSQPSKEELFVPKFPLKTNEKLDLPKVRASTLFGDVQMMQDKIDRYFNSCRSPLLDKNGLPVCDVNGDEIFDWVRPPTIEGLADALGMASEAFQHINKILLYDVQDLAFFEVLRKARQTIEIYWSEALADARKVTGAKFMLQTVFARQTPIEIASTKNKKTDTKVKEKQLDGSAKDDAITINVVRKDSGGWG